MRAPAEAFILPDNHLDDKEVQLLNARAALRELQDRLRELKPHDPDYNVDTARLLRDKRVYQETARQLEELMESLHMASVRIEALGRTKV